MKARIIILFVFFLSCKQDKLSTDIIKLDCIFSTSLIDSLSNITIEKQSDKMVFHLSFKYKDKGESLKIKEFRYLSNGFYELKINKNLQNQIIDTNYVLTFSIKDTMFTYEHDVEKYLGSRYSGFENFNYLNRSVNNCIELKKTNIYDKTFTEEYYYDNQFNFKLIKFTSKDDYHYFIPHSIKYN